MGHGRRQCAGRPLLLLLLVLLVLVLLHCERRLLLLIHVRWELRDGLVAGGVVASIAVVFCPRDCVPRPTIDVWMVVEGGLAGRARALHALLHAQRLQGGNVALRCAGVRGLPCSW